MLSILESTRPTESDDASQKLTKRIVRESMRMVAQQQLQTSKLFKSNSSKVLGLGKMKAGKAPAEMLPSSAAKPPLFTSATPTSSTKFIRNFKLHRE